ncbi:hypothetical protein M0R45_025899 [Rubus argutus]|uniref:Uncharacterized protein n=1 Tax=Rubus argutus TaxID=59490 RepID=A0AAW1WVJ2_RUBAR
MPITILAPCPARCSLSSARAPPCSATTNPPAQPIPPRCTLSLPLQTRNQRAPARITILHRRRTSLLFYVAEASQETIKGMERKEWKNTAREKRSCRLERKENDRRKKQRMMRQRETE